MHLSSLPGCMPNPTRRDDVNAAVDAARGEVDAARGVAKWFRQPVLWLGAAIFLASLVGCIATIVLAWRHADAPVETAGGTVMKVPMRHQPGHQAGAR